MKKRKFMVVSGFLGSGKTTSMIQFADYLYHQDKKAAIISNDLGAKNLVDAIYTSLAGCCSTAMPGECICYTTEALVDKIKRLSDVEHADLVMSDIPGCGVGALDHVYFKLNREYPDDFELAPFTVVCDPERLRAIMPEHADINLPEEMNYLFRTQLLEADVIVLNKIDTITEEEKKKCVEFLNEEYKDIPVFTISAREKSGIGELVDYLMTHQARLVDVDTGYGGEEFCAAEAKLSWYDCRFFVKKSEQFDGNQFVEDYTEVIRKKIKEHGKNIPHLKIYLSSVEEETDFAKVSLVGIDYETEHDHKLGKAYEKYTCTVNVRAACESDLLDVLMKEALDEMKEKYELECRVYATECFGMMDEGA